MPIKTIAIITLFTGAMGVLYSCSHGHNTDSGRALPEKVSYNFNIRPILSDKCFKCHGPDASHREAHLRLDIADSAYAPLKDNKGRFCHRPGKPDQSELYKRVILRQTYMMPPPDAHLGML